MTNRKRDPFKELNEAEENLSIELSKFLRVKTKMDKTHTRSVNILESQAQWLEARGLNLSLIVRDTLKKLMKQNDSDDL